MAGLMEHKSKKHKKEKLWIKCEQCEWQVKSSAEMELHKQQVHFVECAILEKDDNTSNPDDDDTVKSPEPADNSSNDVPKNVMEDEITNLKRELKFIKNRFEQVMESHNDVEKDMEEMKKKYEEELAKVRNEFVKVKAEKEHFRVRNDLLHNMSKIIVERCLVQSKPDDGCSKGPVGDRDPAADDTKDNSNDVDDDDDIAIFVN